MPITTAVFDAYGTLFDVASAARRAAEDPQNAAFSPVWMEVAKEWRNKQLQYTWLRAVAGQHCDFWQVTKDGLDWALEAQQLNDPALRERLLALYWELDAYPEVLQMLTELKSAGLQTAILSNGSPDMLEAAVTSAGLAHVLDAVLSVEDVQIFKPATQVYDMVGAHFSCAKSDVLFVSSNGWDAAGAAHYGFNTVWVNRANEPVDRLYSTPTHHMSDLTQIPTLIKTGASS